MHCVTLVWHAVCSKIQSSQIAILTVTSPIVINVPTRGLLAVETKDSLFCGWQNLNIKRLVCKQ